MKPKKDHPNIMRWYNHGAGTGTIQERLVNEYGYTDSEASQLIEEVIYTLP